jgi:hypothetical protein
MSLRLTNVDPVLLGM